MALIGTQDFRPRYLDRKGIAMLRICGDFTKDFIVSAMIWTGIWYGFGTAGSGYVLEILFLLSTLLGAASAGYKYGVRTGHAPSRLLGWQVGIAMLAIAVALGLVLINAIVGFSAGDSVATVFQTPALVPEPWTGVVVGAAMACYLLLARSCFAWAADYAVQEQEGETLQRF